MDFSNPAELVAFVSDALPTFKSTGEARELSGGNLNYVWRVFGERQSVVVKHAPPFIARVPEIPISPQRIRIEASVLRLFEVPPLQLLASDDIRPPRLLYADEKRHTIILEDVGDLVHLDRLEMPGMDIGSKLGSFFGQLHRSTFQHRSMETIDNLAIQQTRLEVQYASIGALLSSLGFSSAEELGGKARKLGEKYLTKGKCLTMGDLWPRSVLADTDRRQIRIIDWEFAHYGRPAQDVAHFLAHLWMLGHRAPSAAQRTGIMQLQRAFIEGYMSALGPAQKLLFNEEEIKDAGIHFGAEILVRTIGNFQNGYLYDGLPPDHPKVRAAVDMAVRCLEDPLALWNEQRPE